MNAPCHDVPLREFVQLGERRTGYVRWGGSGPIALLVHGIVNSAYSWWQFAPQLVQQGYTVISIDQPGHGASDLPAAHTVDGIASELGSLIEALDLRDIFLIGHSWGGATALAFASGEHPARERLARVALLDPAMAMSAAYGAQALPRYLALLQATPEQNIERGRAEHPDWYACDLYWRSVALHQAQAAAIEGFFIGSGDWVLSQRLADVAIPLKLLLAEAEKTVVPASVLAEIPRYLQPKLGQLLRVPGTEHNMFYGAGCGPTLRAIRD
jgi:pimeloyl-ACP methyl ester carboxylesterase